MSSDGLGMLGNVRLHSLVHADLHHLAAGKLGAHGLVLTAHTGKQHVCHSLHAGLNLRLSIPRVEGQRVVLNGDI